MLGISCLVKDTQLRHDLNDIVELSAYERVSKGLPAGLRDIYNDLRQTGVEVDLQTVGFIYNDVLPKTFSEFDTDEDVNEYVLKNYNDAIRRAALLQAPEPSAPGQIGQDKPEISVVDRLLDMFYKGNTTRPAANYTDMRAMQEAIWNGVKRKLDLSKNAAEPNDVKTWQDLLNQAIGYESLGMEDINGQLNSIADLFEATKEQLRDATDKLEAQGDFATAEKWRNMINKLQSAAYTYLFSKQEARQFMIGIMKDAKFTKETKSGNTVIDWNKLTDDRNSIQDLRTNVDTVLRNAGYSQSVIDGVKDAFEDEFNDLSAKVLEKRAAKLATKEENLGKVGSGKSDLRRLAELNNLGIFDSAHDRLLNSIIGISDLQSEDLEDLKKLSNAASELYKRIDKDYGSDVFASFEFQNLQRHIDRIIQRNINDKSKMLKIVSAIKNFFDILLTSLLMGPLTILENFTSGVKETVSSFFLGENKFTNKEDRQLYSSMLMDVLKRGQSFGEEVGSFAPRELYSNSLQYKWKGATIKQKMETVLAGIMTPARLGLLGFDSANKAVITNKVFHNSMFQALTQNGMSKDDAAKFLNEALHGENFEKSKEKAKEILETVNSTLPSKFHTPVNDNTIVRLANDLVKANLNTNGSVTTEMIESVLKGSYHVAGYGLGHEPNNMLSKMVKSRRDEMLKAEQELIQKKKWDALAWQRMKNTIANSVVLKFTGGATNWIFLRAQSGLGLGLATGFMGKWNEGLDFENKDTIKQSIKDVQGARNEIGRALTGLSYTVLGYAAMYALQGGSGDDEKKKRRLKELQAIPKADFTKENKDELDALNHQITMYRRIRANYEGNRLFKKMAPDAMLISYYIDTDDDALKGVLDYVTQTGGISQDYSTSGKVSNAIKYVSKGDKEAAYGELGSIIGNQLAVPIWRSYKEWFKLGSWVGQGFEGVSSDFKKPSNFAEGILGGGFLEDIHAYKRNSAITILPGLGPKAYEKFKAKGMSRMDDLEKNPEWYNEKYINENGNEEYILDKSAREKAKAGADKWFKQMK